MVLPRSEGEPEGDKMASTSGGDEGDTSTSTVTMDSPNTHENVTKITLSSSPSGSDIQETRLDLSLEETEPEEAGTDNPAFETDEPVAKEIPINLNGGTTLEKETEAVNLELVHMAPYSNGNGYNSTVGGVPGIPVKKEIEAEASTPYDEYFVPVNEHRKYMRGEKLYVTMDKRKTASWRRCCSWVAGCSVLGAVIIVAILAGTGVINMQEPGIVKEASVGRSFGVNQLPPSETKSSSSTPIPTSATNSTFNPTTDMSYMQVPRSIQGEIRLDAMEMNDALKDPSSAQYRMLSSDLEEQIKNILFSQNILKYGSADINLKVTEFRSGSVVVTYRLAWTFKPGIRNPPDPITMDELVRKLEEALQRNGGYLGQYHVDETSIKAGNVMDPCQLDVTGCPGHCEFDYKDTLRATCVCPENQRWVESMKVCEVEPEVAPEPEPSAEPKPEPKPEPEPTAEPTPHPEPAAEPTPHPEPTPEPTSHPEPVAEPTPHPEPKAEPTPHPEPKAEPTPHPEPAAEPTPQAEPEPTPHPEPAAEPTSHPEPKAEPTPHPEPAAEPTPHAEPEPTPRPEPSAVPEPTPEPKAEPEPVPSTEAPAKMMESTTDHIGMRMGPEFASTEPTAEPVPEPTAIPEPQAEPKPEPTPPSQSVHPTTATITEMKSNLEVLPGTTEVPQHISTEKSKSESEIDLTLIPTPEPEPAATEAPVVKSEIQSEPEGTTLPSQKGELEVLAPPTSLPDVEEITAKANAEGITEKYGRLTNAADTEHSPVEVATEAGSELKFSRSTMVPSVTETALPEVKTVSSLDEKPKIESLGIDRGNEDVHRTVAQEVTTVKPTPSFAENYRTELENEHLNAVGNDVYDNLAADKYSTLREKYTDNYELSTEKPKEKEIVISDPNLDKITLSEADAHLFPSTEPSLNGESDGEDKEKYKKKKEYKKKTKDGKNFELGDITDAKSDVEILVSSTESAAVVMSTNPLAETISVENVNKNEATTPMPNRMPYDMASGRSMGSLMETTLSPMVEAETKAPFASTEKNKDMEAVPDTTLQPMTTDEPIGVTEVVTLSSTPEEKKLPENVGLLKTEIQADVTTPPPVSDPVQSETKMSEKEMIDTTIMPPAMTTIVPEAPHTEASRHNDQNSAETIGERTESITAHEEPTTLPPQLFDHSSSVATTTTSSDARSSTRDFSATTIAPPQSSEGAIGVTTILPPSQPQSSNGPSDSPDETTSSPQTSSSASAITPLIDTANDSPSATTIQAAAQTQSPVPASDSFAATTIMPPQASDTPTTILPPLQPRASEPADNVTHTSTDDISGFFSKCASGQFECKNGTNGRGSVCVPMSSKCDSINDCSDGSDEIGCIEKGCLGNFQCADGSCLNRHLVCNGIPDCFDGSDEQNCADWKCEFDEFRCPSGRCIPVVWQCNGRADCEGHSDEYNCQESCGNDEFLCPERWCIPMTYRCNGAKECANGEDEQLCECSVDQFKCESGGCVSKSQVCDGIDHCPDRSDEWRCIQIDNRTKLLQIRNSEGTYKSVCSDNWTGAESDLVCRSLGYHHSISSEIPVMKLETSEPHLILNGTPTKSLLVNFIPNQNECQSGRFVQLGCQDFSCGSQGMSDGVAARMIEGGTMSGQLPSVALLYNNKNTQSCTASIISPRWAVGSYNCLLVRNKNVNVEDWRLWSGSTKFEPGQSEGYNVSAIVPYPQAHFNQFLYDNDVALVELAGALSFSQSTGAVCLPDKQLEPRQLCVTAGWGVDPKNDGGLNQYLNYLPVPITDLETCNSTKFYPGLITKDKICAGFTDTTRSLCSNDEGAPLMCINPVGVWELRGVLSYHKNCGRGSRPSIFSDVSAVRKWIEETTGNSFRSLHSGAVQR